MRYHEVKESIKALKKELEDLEDAASTIEEAMGDPLKLFVGECLVEVDEDAATSYAERVTEEKQAELEKLGDELDETEDELKTLKSFLYARFGNNINLEENK